MWHAFDSSTNAVQALFDTITTDLKATLARDGRAGLAVSGGRTPIPLFERLSGADLDWSNVCITLVDDRFVAADHEDSNEHLVRRHLLVNRAARAQFAGLVSDPDNMQACLDHANRLDGTVNIAILGMGDDGHTASLFPGAPQLPDALDRDQTLRYLHITPPAAPHERISMTLAALLQADRLILMLSGTHKRQIFEQAKVTPSAVFPVSYVATQSAGALDVYWHA